MREPLPPGAPVPDSVDPIIGWRAWTLRERRGRLELAPMFQTRESWPALRAMHASCVAPRTRRSVHRAPSEACSCGVYALDRPDALSRAYAVAGRGAAVVGSVALWGKVIVHSSGHRAEFAYPDRIRLVCVRCLIERRAGTPDHVVRAPDGTLRPACSEHAPRPGLPAGEVQARLLSTYAVDLLPVEVLRAAGFGRPQPTRSVPAAPPTRRSVRRGALAATVAAVLAFLLVRDAGLLGPGRSRPASAPIERETSVEPPSEIPIEALEFPPRAAPIEERERDRRPPRLALVCAEELPGGVGRIRSCGHPRADLLGFADSPAVPRSSCLGDDAYTRKHRFSVCWMGMDPDREGSAELRLPGVRWWDLRS